MTSHREPDPSLVTGASGYVGGLLIAELLAAAARVRALARDPDSARRSRPGRRPRGRRAVSGRGLREALDGCRTAYYLIHSMGRGSATTTSPRRDREAAVNFGEAARDGRRRARRLPRRPRPDGRGRLRAPALPPRGRRAAAPAGAGARLRARGDDHRAGQRLVRDAAPPRDAPAGHDHARAGSTRARSPSRSPTWSRALADVGRARATPPGEVQLGGADVLTYREMMAAHAPACSAAARRRS